MSTRERFTFPRCEDSRRGKRGGAKTAAGARQSIIRVDGRPQLIDDVAHSLGLSRERMHKCWRYHVQRSMHMTSASIMEWAHAHP